MKDLEALIMRLEAGTFTLQLIVRLVHTILTSYGDTLPPVCQPDTTGYHLPQQSLPSFPLCIYILEVIRFRRQRPGNEAVLCTCYNYLCIVQYCL